MPLFARKQLQRAGFGLSMVRCWQSSADGWPVLWSAGFMLQQQEICELLWWRSVLLWDCKRSDMLRDGVNVLPAHCVECQQELCRMLCIWLRVLWRWHVRRGKLLCTAFQVLCERSTRVLQMTSVVIMNVLSLLSLLSSSRSLLLLLLLVVVVSFGLNGPRRRTSEH